MKLFWKELTRAGRRRSPAPSSDSTSSPAGASSDPDYLPHLADLAASLEPSLQVIDVGCRWGEAGVWTRLQPHVSIIGFDPDADECRRLNAESAEYPATRFIPRALGPAAGTATIHLTAEAACSSLYPPDRSTLRQRPYLALASPVGTAEIEMTTLDEWLAGEKISQVDFIKIDTQGSELGVLGGSERALESVSALEVEVEFNPIYEGQPLFGHIDHFLRERGFVLWRFGNLVHYGMPDGLSEFKVRDQVFFDESSQTIDGRGGQLFWCNAFYVGKRSAFGEPPVSWQTGLRAICTFAALGFWDLAAATAARLPHDTPAKIKSSADAMVALVRR